MSDNNFNDPTTKVVFHLAERNRLAERTISEFASKHATMDIGVGLVGLIPGAGLPALIVAIAAQSPVIYQPLARRLAEIYLVDDPAELSAVRANVLRTRIIENAIIDIAAEFGFAFIMEIAGELALELGIGGFITFIPIVGAFAAAGLDYMIATSITKRVGKMVAIYFQNGGQWVGSKSQTSKIASGLSDNLNNVRENSEVRESLLHNLKSYVEMMRAVEGTDQQIREELRKRAVPEDLINELMQ